MQVFNQYSAVFSLVIPLGLLTVAVVGRKRPFLSRGALVLGLLLLVIAGFFLLQPETNNLSPGQVETLLAAAPGQPVFLEIYSDY